MSPPKKSNKQSPQPKAKSVLSKRSRKVPLRTNSTVVNNGFTPVVINHREMIGTVVMSAADEGKTVEYRISATDSTTFPWLSQLAKCFEYYDFNRLSFEYIPRCSALTPGSCILAIDYDVNDVNTSSHRQDISTMEGSIEDSVSANITVSAKPQHLHVVPYRYCNANGIDPRLEFVGKIVVNACGVPTGGVAVDMNVGTLYVSYSVRLFAPQFPEVQATIQKRSQTSGTPPIWPFGQTVLSATSSHELLKDIVTGGPDITNGVGLHLGEYGRFAVNCLINSPEEALGQVSPITIADAAGVTKLIDANWFRFPSENDSGWGVYQAIVDTLQGANSAFNYELEDNETRANRDKSMIWLSQSALPSSDLYLDIFRVADQTIRQWDFVSKDKKTNSSGKSDSNVRISESTAPPQRKIVSKKT
jgi:hypothetical protein